VLEEPGESWSAHRVEDEVDPVSAGRRRDPLLQSGLAVVDRAVAPWPSANSVFSFEPASAITRLPAARASWTSAYPMPPAAAWINTDS